MKRALKVRNTDDSYSALSELHGHYFYIQGRRASLRSALAPGYHISRLRRWMETRTIFLCAFLRLFVANYAA
jgi:hypothetical protein